MSLRRVGQVGCAALIALTVAIAPPGREQGSDLKLSSAAGALSLSNSKGGGAIFSASNLGPGGVTSGSITISNTGELPGAVTLSDSNLAETRGTGGGLLSNRLELMVIGDTDRALGRLLYIGQLGALPDLPLGVLKPGQRRDYRFVVEFPQGTPAADNFLANASLEVSYVWSAVSVEGAPPVAPPMAPPVAPPIAPSPDGTSPASVDRRAPLVRLVAKPKRRTLRRGYLVVRAHCDEWCRISGRARWRIARKRASSRVRTRRASANRWTRLKISIPRRARRSVRAAMSDRRRLSLRLALTASDAAGNKRRVRSRIPLKNVVRR